MSPTCCSHVWRFIDFSSLEVCDYYTRLSYWSYYASVGNGAQLAVVQDSLVLYERISAKNSLHCSEEKENV